MHESMLIFFCSVRTPTVPTHQSTKSFGESIDKEKKNNQNKSNIKRVRKKFDCVAFVCFSIRNTINQLQCKSWSNSEIQHTRMYFASVFLILNTLCHDWYCSRWCSCRAEKLRSYDWCWWTINSWKFKLYTACSEFWFPCTLIHNQIYASMSWSVGFKLLMDTSCVFRELCRGQSRPYFSQWPFRVVASPKMLSNPICFLVPKRKVKSSTRLID